jgi:hypothetical protein
MFGVKSTMVRFRDEIASDRNIEKVSDKDNLPHHTEKE